jgi:hypothetical protein
MSAFFFCNAVTKIIAGPDFAQMDGFLPLK